MIEVRLDGFGGNPASLITWEATATGVVVRIMEPLATALLPRWAHRTETTEAMKPVEQ